LHLKLDIEREIEMRNIVEIKEVFKTIDKEEILSGINLQIAEGEIYGFLGPNGAGKTTLMKCMLTLSTITSGSIEIFGKSYYACTNFNKVKFYNEKVTHITNSFRIFIRLLCRCG